MPNRLDERKCAAAAVELVLVADEGGLRRCEPEERRERTESSEEVDPVSLIMNEATNASGAVDSANARRTNSRVR